MTVTAIEVRGGPFNALLPAARAALAEEAGPKAHTGPSGWGYEAPRNGGDLWRLRREGSMHHFKSADDPMIPPCDLAFVAKLMESKGVTP